jgi:hypothetical protein
MEEFFCVPGIVFAPKELPGRAQVATDILREKASHHRYS